MKEIKLIISLIVLFLITTNVQAQKIPAYYKVGTVNGTMTEVKTQVVNALNAKNFKIFGSYSPAGKSSYKVIAFTRSDIYGVTLIGKDQRVLASMLKVGLYKTIEGVEVSLLNPEYIFNAYLGDKISTNESKLQKITQDVKDALKTIGTDFTPFGGGLTKKELRKYHYMMAMPYFDDPVELKTFSSFAEGVKKIEANLAAKKGKTVKVYRLKFEKSKIAIYGVGLLDKEKGEAAFLPKIGTKHIAALPYEILLLDNKAIILHGKYRLALHWPNLTMGQFMKISSTPGDIEDMLKALTE
ncbi:MAG: hypothetical protein DRJ10_19815 [Bacteroidetes bacterium]|nr:MAG: hypothetical protein DRJ10_19815 [Bacteroidota bacterium]